MGANDKVSFSKLVNATVHVTNSVYSDRTYDIIADVTVNNENVESVNNGVAKSLANNTELANFDVWGSSSMSVNYNAESDIDTKVAILRAINEFIEDVKAKVASGQSLETFTL